MLNKEKAVLICFCVLVYLFLPRMAVIQYFFFFCIIIWLIAVYKVFIHDDYVKEIEKELHIIPSKEDKSSNIVEQHIIALKPTLEISSPKEETTIKDAVHEVVIDQNSKKSDYIKLEWPPVLPDGSFPLSDGFDLMPLTGLKVPKFWIPPEGIDLNTIGTHVNGEETIFLMIASYRDFQCKETIASAFNRADHPERLYVGAVDQLVEGEGNGCLDLQVPCSDDSEQAICKYRNQISIFKMDAQLATGPVTARHIGDRMYRGQYYVMQMDAHCLFVRHWDRKQIEQFKATGNDMAVLR
jgi:hypothetical protein